MYKNYNEYLESKEYKKEQRRQRYLNKDIKNGKIIIDQEKCRVEFIMSKEDSIDRLYDLGLDFSEEADIAQSFEQKQELKMMYSALEMLEEAERELIVQIYFRSKTEAALSLETNVSAKTIHSRKKRILEKLKDIIEKLEDI